MHYLKEILTSAVYRLLPNVGAFLSAVFRVTSSLFFSNLFFSNLFLACLFLPNLTMSRMVMARSVPILSDIGSTELAGFTSGTNEHLFDVAPDEGLSWVDKTEIYLASTVHDFSSFIDHGLAKEEDEEPLINRSYILLKSAAEYSHRGYFESDARVSVRIDLPHTERKWDLIFETDPEDYDSLESKQRDLTTKDATGESKDAIGGIRLYDGLMRNWKSSYDIGVKLRFPMDPFIRADLRRVEDCFDDWVTQFRQQVFYYYSIGAGAVTGLSFYHALDEDKSQIIRFGSSAQYLYDDRQWELLFQLGLSDRINNDNLLEYSTGISVDPNHSDEITNYWISFAWHQNLYKNWLYFSVIPKIDAPREYDYKINPGGQLKLEMFFSKNRRSGRLNRAIPESTRRAD